MKHGTLVVTGGSRGIGAAAALKAAAQGWSVAVNYSASAAAAQQVVEAIKSQGGRALAIKADVSREDDVRDLFATAQAELGPITGLINNAGILRERSSLADIALDRFVEMVGINMVGAFLCAREAVRLMSRASGGQGGVIVNVSSRAAILGGAGEAIDYAMTKGAMDTLTVGLASEVGRDGIRVNGVRPGLIETEMQAASGDPDRAKRLSASAPLGRPGTSDEVAEAIVYLLSPSASYITGATLDVSGGR